MADKAPAGDDEVAADRQNQYSEDKPPQGSEKTPLSANASGDGYWGDSYEGGPVDPQEARHDFDELQQELSRRSTTRSTDVEKANRSRPGEEADSFKSLGHDDFHLEQFMRGGHLEKRHPVSGKSTKKVGVVFKDLSVKGVGSSAATVRTLPQAIAGTFGPDLYDLLSGWVPGLQLAKTGPSRELIRRFTGVIRPGEMMLVLGRPGSGCSTLLKVIANNRGSFQSVEGDVFYGGISASEMDKRFRGEVVYNAEDDRHLPNLSVGQTLDFSLRTKTRQHERGNIELIIDSFLKMFAMSHVKHTPVGDEYVRGVSGGERKRVSIAETLATKSTVTCWDNSTRGLDASTAFNYAKSLRIMTDVSDRTTLTTLYQAGEGIYELMDKVLVIDDGRMLYQGPVSEARQYFIDLGFHCPPRQTTADFLTSVCDVNVRRFRHGYSDRCPKTAEELEEAFRKSRAYQRVLEDVGDFEQHMSQTENVDAQTFQKSVRESKSKTVMKGSSYTVSFWKQILACTRREFWLIWGDKTSLYTKFFIIISNGLIVGSLFYNTPSNTRGAFLRGGVSFFSILFLGWLQLSELAKAVSGRSVILRQKDYAFYRPSAVNLARVLADFPMLVAEVIVFGVIMYFMTNLDIEAGKFFIYMLFVYAITICVTALYRMFAACSPNMDAAIRFAGTALNLLIVFTGYAIPKPVLLNQKIWFGWIYYLNPVSYAFEAVLANEFSGRDMECASSQLVPRGPGIEPQYQGCAISGSQPGNPVVPGSRYLSEQFEYSRAHLWRNFGVIVAFTILYILVTVAATEVLSFASSGMGGLVFTGSKKAKELTKRPSHADEEETPDDVLEQFTRSANVFTWEDIGYTVPTPQGPKKLLNDIQGYAKPGVMVALMGASGAGKTTLLNTLSQRQTVGRRTGFVEQMDLHEGTATVREALEFSALLRQGRDIPRHDKIDYVNKVIDLLELTDIQGAMVGSLGVEPKKRLTIGVELAAKPSLLLFLDEPTSGLDSQSAFSIVRFLRKLCASGQAIVCTIHQPSSELIETFDYILALNPGGNTFYFGPVGHNGSAVIDYFAARGARCPEGKNVAEFLIETSASAREQWNELWRTSDENRALQREIQRIKDERSSQTQEDAQVLQHEFAAPVALQAALLTKRMFVNQWRAPSYIYGKLFVAVIAGIFNGFTFWKLGDTVNDMQSRMFTSFLIVLIPPTVLNAILPKFYMDRALWEGREYPSRIYGWVAFCTASVLSEIPGSLISGILYWALWYWPTGLPTDSSTSGYVFLMTILFFLFQSSWGQWICAWAPSFTVISNVLPFFLVMFSLINGVVVPYEQLNPFWKYWVYWLNPSTYWIGGVLAATLPRQAVRCAQNEAAHFRIPSGQMCSQFASAFIEQAGAGYLIDPDGRDNCSYCPYSNGREYLAALDIEPSQKWRDFSIFLAFCFSNWALIYFFIYTVRIKKWSFGFGLLFKYL
ncbi:ABC-2 type transporter domain-containing protein [Hirsutella rhossiliensis]|uniref:ABC-2 type transporter domain-containing protein n=1 Tax=Hirsutella rhossiliensis TaxID=111463 RepID=A0A9P8MQX8_9HYPO|nr:ABC-2 type transporter domain-containing protein [Hirsutella rhossiliensis]KAH0960158.1 ABC-2 type transporter domain-containing protein [Hirsutella rhossiliensis]